ncbi:MAG TPA: hypothetical protein VIF62_05615, partial [Labilithrix sp.]
MRLSISRLAILGATAMLAATACGGGGSSSSPGGSASSIVGPSGGTVEGEGVRLDVPEGALQASVAIRIERTEDPAPDGFAALTPLFHFTPEGLTFAKPATVWIEYQGDAATAVVVWSSGAGVEELASSRESDGLTAS